MTERRSATPERGTWSAARHGLRCGARDRGLLDVHPGHRSSRSECTETGPAARRPVPGSDGRERPSTVQPGVVSNVPVSVCDFVGRMGERATTL